MREKHIFNNKDLVELNKIKDFQYFQWTYTELRWNIELQMSLLYHFYRNKDVNKVIKIIKANILMDYLKIDTLKFILEQENERTLNIFLDSGYHIDMNNKYVFGIFYNLNNSAIINNILFLNKRGIDINMESFYERLLIRVFSGGDNQSIFSEKSVYENKNIQNKILNSKIKLLEFLLDKWVDINTILNTSWNKNNYSIVHYLVISTITLEEKLYFLKYLFKKGINLNIRDSQWNTGLLLFLKKGCWTRNFDSFVILAITKLFIKHWADINIKNSHWENALSLTVNNNVLRNYFLYDLFK